jgi:hypothetical protein
MRMAAFSNLILPAFIHKIHGQLEPSEMEHLLIQTYPGVSALKLI